MADEGNIISDLNLDVPEGPVANGEDTSPQIGFLTQYVKDLSVENPNAPDSFQWQDAPQVDVQFNIAARRINDEIHEVELKTTVTSKGQGGTQFLVDLAYCGLLGMRNVTDEQAHPVLYAEAPRLLFPFARRVLSDAVRDAGFPPLMLEPIDFQALYMQQLAAREQAAEQPPAGNA